MVREYLAQERNDGHTIMWHGLRAKCQVVRDILPVLKRFGVREDVQYIYLPLVHWDKDRGSKPGVKRNKGSRGAGDSETGKPFCSTANSELNTTQKIGENESQILLCLLYTYQEV